MEHSVAMRLPKDRIRRNLVVVVGGETSAGQGFGARRWFRINPDGFPRLTTRCPRDMWCNDPDVWLDLIADVEPSPGATVTFTLDWVNAYRGVVVDMGLEFPRGVSIVEGETHIGPITIESDGKSPRIRARVTFPRSQTDFVVRGWIGGPFRRDLLWRWSCEADVGR